MQVVAVSAWYCLCSFSFSSPCCICLYCSALRGQERSAFIHFLALCIMEHHVVGNFSLDCRNITVVILVEVLCKVSCIKDIWDSGNIKLRAVTSKNCECLQVEDSIFAYKFVAGFYQKKPLLVCGSPGTKKTKNLCGAWLLYGEIFLLKVWWNITVGVHATVLGGHGDMYQSENVIPVALGSGWNKRKYNFSLMTLILLRGHHFSF